MIALGLIESVGFSTAISAADAAVKAADVEILGIEKVIGVDGYVSVTVHLSGDVAAVTSAVEAGTHAGESVGNIVSSHVIPRTHANVKETLIDKYMSTEEANQKSKQPHESTTKKTDNQRAENSKKSTNTKPKDQENETVKNENGK
ncbi:BMC domain-containing protein [Natribacillus halophilus]|uniref:Carboxysome shell and ethanolamine utilization microcompartment protein CcmL/EutN n=1 Tax=Natribacillus halophilus TaxID=549003 RepID=A0A1G8N0E0_9BACI|nr:BMC domain-containing protein [Natribacillus halophilus]SDI73644.1 Carboxysome shell and ethanolamine utilization microcompartment protein CcmL/EutN [Natribacillus halophilus]